MNDSQENAFTDVEDNSDGPEWIGADMDYLNLTQKLDSFFDSVYDLLVETCQAPEYLRIAFVGSQTEHCLSEQTRWMASEFCFEGALGYGGKFSTHIQYWDAIDRAVLYVSYYMEDDSPERRKTREETNQALEVLAKKLDQILKEG